MIRWADPAAIERAVLAYADDVRRRHPHVSAIHWYAHGHPAARRHPVMWTSASWSGMMSVPALARVPDYLPDRFPVPLDLAVLTEAEWRQLPERAPGWFRAIAAGRTV